MPTELTNTEPFYPYRTEYHKQHSEASMAALSKEPLMSAEEAYAQYDRLKAHAQKLKAARPPTLLSKKR